VTAPTVAYLPQQSDAKSRHILGTVLRFLTPLPAHPLCRSLCLNCVCPADTISMLRRLLTPHSR